MNLPSLKLQAIYQPHNIQRFYYLRAGKDLLGEWLVGASYGRIGHKGQARLWVCSSQEEAQKKVRALLSRRFHAQRRIGTNYDLLYQDFDRSLNPNDWLKTSSKT